MQGEEIVVASHNAHGLATDGEFQKFVVAGITAQCELLADRNQLGGGKDAAAAIDEKMERSCPQNASAAGR